MNLEALLNDHQSGSLEITQQALKYFRECFSGDSRKSLEHIYDALQTDTKSLTKKHPNNVLLRKLSTNLLISCKRFMKTEKDAATVLADLYKKIDQMEEELLSNAEKIAALGSRIIAHSNKVMTIGNSSLVKRICASAQEQRRKFEVFCLLSHPPGEGADLAEHLLAKGIKVTLLADNEMGVFAPQMNLIILGATRLCEDGFVNKAGSLPLCLTAQHFSVPVYLAAETNKILFEKERAFKAVALEKSAVYHTQNKNLRMENIYHEKIPMHLAHKILCEDGVFDALEFMKWYLKE